MIVPYSNYYYHTILNLLIYYKLKRSNINYNVNITKVSNLYQQHNVYKTCKYYDDKPILLVTFYLLKKKKKILFY